MLYWRTRRHRGSLWLEKVYSFIVVKQWKIVLPQHKRSICSCGRKVENSSHLFPSSLPDNLQTPFARLLVTTWLIHTPKTFNKNNCCHYVIHLSIHDKVASVTICIWYIITPSIMTCYLIPKRKARILELRLQWHYIAFKNKYICYRATKIVGLQLICRFNQTHHRRWKFWKTVWTSLCSNGQSSSRNLFFFF